LIRSRVALRLGLQWTEALELNNLNDILDFVGTGLGAAREERIAAKRRILTALVGRESLIDKKHLIESKAFEIGDFLKVRHCKCELSIIKLSPVARLIVWLERGKKANNYHGHNYQKIAEDLRDSSVWLKMRLIKDGDCGERRR